MGMFDGASGRGELASTAHVAKLLDAPLVLVVDATSMARSAAAIVHGFRTFDPDVNVAGVIFNRVGSDHHEELLRDARRRHRRAGARRAAPRRARGGARAPPRPRPGRRARGAGARGARDARRRGRALRRSRRGAARSRAPRPSGPARPGAPAARGRARARRAHRDRPRPGVLLPLPGEPRAARGLGRGARSRSIRSATRRCRTAPVRSSSRAASPRSSAASSPPTRALREEIGAFARSGRPVLAECGGLLYLAAELDGQAMCGALPVRASDDASPHARLPRGDGGHVRRRGSTRASACAATSSTTRRSSRRRAAKHAAWTLAARGTERSEGFVAGGVQASFLHVHWAAFPQIASRLAAAAREPA